MTRLEAELLMSLFVVWFQDAPRNFVIWFQRRGAAANTECEHG